MPPGHHQVPWHLHVNPSKPYFWFFWVVMWSSISISFSRPSSSSASQVVCVNFLASHPHHASQLLLPFLSQLSPIFIRSASSSRSVISVDHKDRLAVIRAPCNTYIYNTELDRIWFHANLYCSWIYTSDWSGFRLVKKLIRTFFRGMCSYAELHYSNASGYSGIWDRLQSSAHGQS